MKCLNCEISINGREIHNGMEDDGNLEIDRRREKKRSGY